MKSGASGTVGAILKRIRKLGRGAVFTPDTFCDLAPSSTVTTSLKRLADDGTLRRLARGLYDYPATHPTIGVRAPSTDAIADALAGRDATRVQASGAYAANLLGLSTQVPMRVVYLTDGRSRQVDLGRLKIILKHTTPKNMATAGTISGLVIQALRHLGQHYVDEDIIATLNRRLDDDARKQLLEDVRYAPAWIGEIMKHLGNKGANPTP